MTSASLRSILIFIILGILILPQFSTYAQSWGIAIEQNPMVTNCGGQQNIQVAAAHSCNEAIKVAMGVWNSAIKKCLQIQCPPNTIIKEGTPTCTVDNYKTPSGHPATRYQVNLPYTCAPVEISCSFVTPSAGMPTLPYWVRGTTVTVKWTIGGYSGPVLLNLVDYCAWKVCASITASTPNSGSYSWKIPSDLACGLYQVYVQNVGTPKIWCYSATFAITK